VPTTDIVPPVKFPLTPREIKALAVPAPDAATKQLVGSRRGQLLAWCRAHPYLALAVGPLCFASWLSAGFAVNLWRGEGERSTDHRIDDRDHASGRLASGLLSPATWLPVLRVFAGGFALYGQVLAVSLEGIARSIATRGIPALVRLVRELVAKPPAPVGALRGHLNVDGRPKVAYSSESAALAVARRQGVQEGRALNAYRCHLASCSAWHVGHASH
jgi:hypothetical protein